MQKRLPNMVKSFISYELYLKCLKIILTKSEARKVKKYQAAILKTFTANFILIIYFN